MPIDMPDLAPLQILNRPDVSVLILQHPKHGFCLNCKTKVAIMLANAQILLTAVPVEVKEPSPIVLASVGAIPQMKR
jgi:hypothetical protein